MRYEVLTEVILASTYVISAMFVAMKSQLQLMPQWWSDKTIHVNNLNCNFSPNISFMSKHVETVSFDKQLGFPIGNVNSQYIMFQAANQFISKVNMGLSHFKYLRYDVIYKLFNGCPLWDYTSKVIDTFYVAWHKSIQHIFNIPHTTHCVLLNQICGDMPVQDQL